MAASLVDVRCGVTSHRTVPVTVRHLFLIPAVASPLWVVEKHACRLSYVFGWENLGIHTDPDARPESTSLRGRQGGGNMS